MSVVQIEKAVPIPPTTGPRGEREFRLVRMQPGDSLRTEYERMGSLKKAVYVCKARNPGWEFTTRVLTDEVTGEKYIRVWRTT